MDWEDYFPTAIAERGYDYYLQGYVTDLNGPKHKLRQWLRARRTMAW